MVRIIKCVRKRIGENGSRLFERHLVLRQISSRFLFVPIKQHEYKCTGFSLSLLKVSPASLFLLDRNKQRLEVSLAETFAAFALQYFVENRRPIFHRLCKDLQQV